MRKEAIPTRLPEAPVQFVLVSGEYPQVVKAIEGLGINALCTEPDFRLPRPVCWHPDMQACVMGSRLIVLRHGPLTRLLREHKINFEETAAEPGERYPQDVLCNVLSWDNNALGNFKIADKKIQALSKQLGVSWIQVQQGYAACSTMLVDEHSAITADPGVAVQLKRHGIQVLQITPGHIELPGYAEGFIGGCCGKLAPDQMAFTGRLSSHPDGGRIRIFLEARKLQAVELSTGPLLDIGGIIPFAKFCSRKVSHMPNPWEELPLEIYESHMQLEQVAQLHALNDIMRRQWRAFPQAASAAVLGVAGGNGLEHCGSGLQTVYGIDINQAYLQECAQRFQSSIGERLRLVQMDLTDPNAELPKVDLVLADLLIEYVGIEIFCMKVSAAQAKYVSCVIQKSDREFVSESPYQAWFAHVGRLHKDVSDQELTSEFLRYGYQNVFQAIRELPNGKEFLRLDYQKLQGERP